MGSLGLFSIFTLSPNSESLCYYRVHGWITRLSQNKEMLFWTIIKINFSSSGAFKSSLISNISCVRPNSKCMFYMTLTLYKIWKDMNWILKAETMLHVNLLHKPSSPSGHPFLSYKNPVSGYKSISATHCRAFTVQQAC